MISEFVEAAFLATQAHSAHDSSGFQCENLIRLPDDDRPVRYDEEGLRSASLEDTLPEESLCVGVERGGQVVHYQQLRPADEHPRRRHPLNLTARESHSSRADRRVEPLLERPDIVLEYCRSDGTVQGSLGGRPSLQYVLADSLAEESRNLRRVGHPWRNKECGWIAHDRSIPEDFPLVEGKQTQKRLEERALARTNPPGDDREGASIQPERNILDPQTCGGVAEAQGTHLERFETVDCLRRSRLGRRLIQIDRRGHRQFVWVTAGNKRAHPAKRHLRLLEAPNQTADLVREPADGVEKDHKHGQIANREGAPD